MILAAGLGTRLKPWTDHHPKALAEVNGKSLLQLNIEYLQRFGITDVVVNVHHFADQIVDAIKRNNGWGSNITISDEQTQVLETGGGFLNAAPHFKNAETIILMNVDILTDLDLTSMIQSHQHNKPLATLAVTDRVTSRYLLFDEDNNLVGWRNTNTGDEKPAGATFNASVTQRAFSGIHVIDTVIFNFIKQQGKFSMIDVYLDLMQHQTIKCFNHSNGKFLDVGKPESIEKATQLFKL